jgi:IrrE N-terminal-like domain
MKHPRPLVAEILAAQPAIRVGQPNRCPRPNADQAAGEFLSLAKGRLPIDVRAIAAALGVDIAHRDLLQAGRLEHRSGQATIVISSKMQSTARRRFTIAHELGHLWLATSSYKLAFDRTAEEQFCNSFAAALLVPREWLIDSKPKTRSMAELETLAYRAQVSWPTALIRLNQICRWRRCLIRWSKPAGRWQATSITALPHGAALDSGGAITVLLEQALRSRERTIEPSAIVRGGQQRTCLAEVRPVSGAVWTLLRFGERRVGEAG